MLFRSSSLFKFQMSVDNYAAEIEQETWHTAVHTIKQFAPRERHSLRNWLWTIQYNHVRNLHRKQIPDPIEDEMLDVLMSDEARPPSPEQTFIEHETRRELLSALDIVLEMLQPHHREIFLLRLRKQIPVETLAQLYGLQPQTIYQIISNARKKIDDYFSVAEFFRNAQRTKTGEKKRSWRQ